MSPTNYSLQYKRTAPDDSNIVYFINTFRASTFKFLKEARCVLVCLWLKVVQPKLILFEDISPLPNMIQKAISILFSPIT